jgi:hypothetical protein
MPTMDNAHALVVGIANYQQANPLPDTVLQEAEEIHGLLGDPEHGGYPPKNVRLLLDGDATRGALCGELERLAGRCSTGSTALVYFSGHGGRVPSGPHAGEYLLPVDARMTSGQALAESAISGEQFSRALGSIPARSVAIILDCCHAGGIGQPRDAAGPAVEAGLPERYYETLTAGGGRAIVASSRSNEVSYTAAGAARSVFSGHLLAGLRGEIPGDDGLIRIWDLFEYLQPRVTGERPGQHPVFKAELTENFAVALRLGGQARAAPADEQGYRYDAYVSYVDREPDSTWVWDTLVPRLEVAGLRVAVSGDVEDPGAYRVVSVERGIRQAKRTVVVLSPAYLADHMAEFQGVLGTTIGIQEGTYRLLPVRFGHMDEDQVPGWLSILVTLNLAHPHRAEREFDRLVRALRGPLPRR